MAEPWHSLPEIVAQTGAVLPEQVAVRDPQGELSYRELLDRAEHLARRLGGLGVAPGDLVGVCLDRSCHLVVAVLAVLKAGAAYVCLDPQYPDERLRFMLEDAGVVAVLSTPEHAARVAVPDDSEAAWKVVSLDGAAPAEHQLDPASTLPDPPKPHAAAYVVYTSGSTGAPKGVVIEHGGLSNLVSWHLRAFELRAGDRCTQISSPGFDAAVWEIWPSLAAGASIHVVPEPLRRDPVGLRDWLHAQQITVSFVPTAMAESVIGLGWPDRGALRYLLTGGDALTRRPPAALGYTVVNNYGLSETTVVATSGTVDPEGDELPSIGRPIDGVLAKVVDEQLRPVAPGEAGELLLGGVAVGRGYLNRPELNAERFVERDRGRWYRTGDRVRQRRDGEIEFVGRVDDQLSIRGFRVEPGEVVAALTSHPGVSAAAVAAVGSSASDRRLVAYVVQSGSGEPPRVDLDVFLSGRLPEHMVPSQYVWLDRLPVTAHGKLDRAALPQPTVEAVPSGPAARDEVEEAITEIMAELLGLESIGMDQNFFLLGGHSMLGAQLIVRLGDQFDVEVSLRHLFDHPTPADVAAEVRRQLADREPSAVPG